MKKNKASILMGLSLCLIGLLQQCQCGNIKFTPMLPETPQNMRDANSIYDDMNSVDPELSAYSNFYFSSNRNSQGKEFDIVSAQFLFVFNRQNKSTRNETALNGGLIKDSFGGHVQPYYVFNQVPKLLPLINTPYNELGPYGYTQNKNTGFFKHFILYSNDSKGDLDVKFAYTLGKYVIAHKYGNPYEDSTTLEQKGNFIAALLNSNSDDAYPSIDDVNRLIYFCSNRSGKFQLYQVKYDPSKDLADELQSAKNTPEIIPSLASKANDKCPFVKGNVMVFVSDRDEGLGGFDLYYSLRGADGAWSAPVNFGASINTSNDEYRPIIDKLDDIFINGDRAGGFSNNLLIFSSNRPGGLGGYDLYFVGVPKLIFP